MRSVYVGFDGADRTFNDQANSDRRREMHHDVRVIDQLSHQTAIFNSVQMVFHAVLRFEVPDILHTPGRKIVQQHHMIATVQETFSEVRTDETGTTGYQIAHEASCTKLQRICIIVRVTRMRVLV